ncbi:unnamed protein product, partial [Gadus morhua 'NCC']
HDATRRLRLREPSAQGLGGRRQEDPRHTPRPPLHWSPGALASCCPPSFRSQQVRPRAGGPTRKEPAPQGDSPASQGEQPSRQGDSPATHPSNQAGW